jgi:acyl-CoA reductase-like NAD-dependent aldehyde dehydrogenase
LRRTLVYEELRDRLVAAVEELEVVDFGEVSCQVGPMIEEDSRSSTLETLARSGGRILTGGEPLDRDGFYLEPTLVELEDPKNPLTDEEILAPVAELLKAGSAEEAVQIANGVRQRHVAADFTSDLDRAMAFAGRLEAGLVRVNAATVGVDYHVTFGGFKDSGIGPEVQGLAARDFYTETRVISISP